MITVNLHTEGRELQTDLPLERISEVLQHGRRSLLWVDVASPTPEDLRLIGEEFAFHPLALEDATKRHQRPKLDTYDGFLFLVFYGLQTHDGRPEAVELDLFIGPNYLVTVHTGDCPAIPATAARWRQNAAHAGRRGIGLLVYALLDAIVDDYFPVIDDLAERIEEVEASVFDQGGAGAQRELFALKKDLLTVRRVIGPERDVLNLLVRRDSPVFGGETVVYFQDVYDHILRVTDAVDTYRDLLSSALDAQLSVTSNRLNQVMKTLTASSIILMSTTLVASVYGMNFDHMPELHWDLGYPWALGLMVSIALAVFTVFRRMDWL